jgi:hypothetical protein
LSGEREEKRAGGSERSSNGTGARKGDAARRTEREGNNARRRRRRGGMVGTGTGDEGVRARGDRLCCRESGRKGRVVSTRSARVVPPARTRHHSLSRARARETQNEFHAPFCSFFLSFCPFFMESSYTAYSFDFSFLNLLNFVLIHSQCSGTLYSDMSQRSKGSMSKQMNHNYLVSAYLSSSRSIFPLFPLSNWRLRNASLSHERGRSDSLRRSGARIAANAHIRG